LSDIMRHINGAYTTNFNARHKRAGHLFRGRYRALLIEADVYAAKLSRYIHISPVRAGMAAIPEGYPWSSYTAYVRLGDPAPWMKTDYILGLVDQNPKTARLSYQKFAQAKGLDDGGPFDKAVAAAILGDEVFVREMVQRYAAGGRQESHPAELKRLLWSPSIDAVIDAVSAGFPDQKKVARKVAIYLCHRLTGAPLKQIGDRFGLKESGVSQASRRMIKTLTEDPKLARQVTRLKKSLSARPELPGREAANPGSAGNSFAAIAGFSRSITLILEGFPEVRFCTLFGSAGRGRMTAHSDVDIAVAAEQKLPAETRSRLAAALSDRLGREVDLIDLQDVAGLILEQALCHSKVVKNADHLLYVRLLKRLWYHQADMVPYIRRILEQRSSRWLR
jgi:putative transposase